MNPSEGHQAQAALQVVLTSGGLDSTTLLVFALAQGTPCVALFVDYGQGARRAEEAAVTEITRRYGVPLRVVRYVGSSFGEGEIRGRNAFLLQIALLEFAGTHGTVLLGIHAGTDYADCSTDFLELMKRSFEIQTGGTVLVEAPFVNWSKLDIVNLAEGLNVPVSSTYSCEAADLVCGSCPSCRERDRVLLGRNVC